MVLELLAVALAFFAAMGLTYGLTTRSGSGSAVDRRYVQLAGHGATQLSPEDASDRPLFRNSVSGVGPLREFLSSRGWSATTARSLESAGLSLKVSEYLAIRLLFGFFFGLFSLLFLGPSVVGLAIAAVIALVGSLLPSFYVRRRVEHRQRLLNSQLAETLQLIANALRSGFAFLQAVKLASSQLAPPMSDELAQFLQDTTLGAPTDQALQAFAERSGSTDVDLVVTTILIQRTTGGRLSEVLESIAETMRERQQLQAEIHAMTAQQRLTGNILTIYPLVLIGIFSLISPSLMLVLVNEPAGRVLLLIAALLQIMGALAMRRILKLEV